MPFYYMDYWYLVLVLPAVLISLWAQLRVKSVFSKYSRRSVGCGMTGRQTSLYIQQQNGISTGMHAVAGSMTDYYDPRSNGIYLSETVGEVSTVAAVGVAAHETGHALQYAEGYGPVRLRMKMVPVTNFASSLSPVLVILGLALSFPALAWGGVVLFSLALLFQLVTLPVEFNASARALRALEAGGRLSEEELSGVKKVLSAAALTYVAATFVSLMSLLRLVLIVAGGGRSRDRR